MKILDRYILTTFVSTLGTVFIILYFIFILQGVWLFIADLAGKDLDIWVILQFLLFYSPKMIPLVLPLSVLLSSIMTFGSFAENYEFAAMKSSGISLQRAMRVLSIFIASLALLSFWFANDVIPKSEYQFINLRREILQTKPAMAIAAGQFNDLGKINIKIDKKTGKKGEYLENVTMHIKSNVGYENKTVIKSLNGELATLEDSNILQLHLLDGNYYEEVESKTYQQAQKEPFIKTKFEKYTINIDLNSFQDNSEDSEKITNTNSMLNVRELNYTIDSLQTTLVKEKLSNTENLAMRTQGAFDYGKRMDSKRTFVAVAPKDLLTEFEPKTQLRIIQSAIDNTSNMSFNAESNDTAIKDRQKYINSHWLALHEKFVIAFSCFLMFYIGAPLGAIIRKGGLGLPIVFAILIFITYHFINTFGKKVAQEDGMTPLLGAWLASMVLTPLAILLTYKATNDSGMFNMDNVLLPIQNAFKKIFKKNKHTNHV
ncbi:LptF/LptG family permease [Flavobacterium sp. NKUCC04_CG]|uniref:LptF/LptG family permease n=1 Tax=Flavobacterium sp. NKUCC04_CG TaxID=2842121 RepID=UPI001C5AC9E1|nr:LptF/LptG family permease [Flavobacterium sp. NKUCC04_CG]